MDETYNSKLDDVTASNNYGTTEGGGGGGAGAVEGLGDKC